MRTPLTYYGGKQRMAPDIVALMPSHQVYLEPFAGGAAVFFHKPRVQRETLNDLDGAVSNFWHVVRDEPLELARALELTPYSRDEFHECRAGLDEELGGVERARRLIVTIDQSFSRGGDSWSPPSLRADRRGRWQPGTWENVPEKIVAAATRLRGVALENADAIPMLSRWDLPECLIYCDPPYTGEHRRNDENTRGYRFDNHPDLWGDLVDALLDLEQANVLLSGYPCAEVERLEGAGWKRADYVQRRVTPRADGDGEHTAPEAVWMNFEPHGALFGLVSS